MESLSFLAYQDQRVGIVPGNVVGIQESEIVELQAAERWVDRGLHHSVVLVLVLDVI